MAKTSTEVEVRVIPVEKLVRAKGFNAVVRESGLARSVVHATVYKGRTPNYKTRLRLARLFDLRPDELWFTSDQDLD